MTNELKYTCLFGGGAIRGLAYIGTIRAFEELGIEYDIIAGSSVGAIFAALLACGYKSYELENIFIKVNFDLFKDIHLGFGKPFALSKGEIFTEWLNELIVKKVKAKDIKHAKFTDLNKDLIIITTNLTNFCTQEFSRYETPDFDIAQAIRISSSMPGLMPPYKYNNADLVDGDLQKASPMWKLSERLNNSESRIAEFRLEGECAAEAKNPVSFINTIYSCVTEVSTEFVNEIYGQNDRYECIRLNTGSIFFADFNLDKESRRSLIESGYQQTMKYFKEFLPQKREKIRKVYSKLLKYLKSAYHKGVKSNNVEETQWWFGDLFTLLCEYKEIVDPILYNKIIELKNFADDSTVSHLIFYKKFINKDELKAKMSDVIKSLELKISERISL